MSRRAAAWFAWSLTVLSVAMFVASGVLDVLARSVRSSGGLSIISTISEAVNFMLLLAFPVVGALVTTRRPRNPIGWILLADGVLWMILSVTESYSVYGAARPGSVPFPVTVGALGNTWLWVPTVGLLGIYLLLLFPDGKLPSRRWLPLAVFSGVVMVSLSIAGGLAPGPLENQGGVPNPFGLEGLPWLVVATYIILPLLPLCILASAISMVLRYRRSRGEERQQFKWIVFAATLVGVLYLIAMLSQLIFVVAVSEIDSSLPPPPWWLDLFFSAAVLSFAGVPVAIGFAVLKYRLYDIDIIINRTLVYGSLTATLIVIYFGGVATMQTLFRAFTGQEQQPQLAVVVSTLAIAALFNPLKRRIQSFIDRRFYRRKYDAAKTLAVFGSRLREETDLDSLSDEMLGVVRETMQPAHASLWLRPGMTSDVRRVERGS